MVSLRRKKKTNQASKEYLHSDALTVMPSSRACRTAILTKKSSNSTTIYQIYTIMVKISLHDLYGLILTIIVEIRSIFVELDYFFVKNRRSKRP